VTYDDQSAMSPLIGLQVHQKSYQWSHPTRDDFIIFQYTITNTGENGDLSDLYTAIWLDPDLGDAGDDLAGYDSPRNLIYLYDSQGNPNGYFGLKLLGNRDSTFSRTIETPDANNMDRYYHMTIGFPSLPNDPFDYHMLLTAQPFDIAVDDSHTVAFGLVMGGSLAELQQHADIMDTIYNTEVVVGIEDFMSNVIPTKFSLAQNYPNPFNPTTTIIYGLRERTIVELKVYDVLGREIETIVNGEQNAGYYEIEFDASRLASGIYFYRLQAGNFIETKKMLLLK
jgi:hypothetical protein